MDLLSQYKQDHPEAFQKQKPQPATDPYGREYRAMMRFVMRLSGGRIRDARQASYALLVVAVIIALISAFLFFNPAGILRPSSGQIFYPPSTP